MEQKIELQGLEGTELKLATIEQQIQNEIDKWKELGIVAPDEIRKILERLNDYDLRMGKLPDWQPGGQGRLWRHDAG